MAIWAILSVWAALSTSTSAPQPSPKPAAFELNFCLNAILLPASRHTSVPDPLSCVGDPDVMQMGATSLLAATGYKIQQQQNDVDLLACCTIQHCFPGKVWHITAFEECHFEDRADSGFS